MSPAGCMPLTAGDVVVRGRRGPRRAHRLAGPAGRARARDRDRPPPGAARSSETLAGVANVRLLFADALDLDLAALDPPPAAMVANLPYGVATPVLIRAPARDRALLRDGAARDRRAPLRRSRARRPTAPCRCSCSSPASAPAARAVSRQRVRAPAERRLDARRLPPPARLRVRPGVGVDGAGRPRRLRPPPKDAPKLAARWPGCPRRRPRSPACGPSSSPPERLGRLARGSSRLMLRAPAKVNLCLRVGPLRSDGYHRLTTLFQAIDRYDELELSEAADETVVEGFADDTLVRAALAALGETRRVRLREAHPGRRGPRRRLVGRRGGAAGAARRARPERAARDRPRARRRRPVLPHRRRDGLRHRPRRPHPAAARLPARARLRARAVRRAASPPPTCSPRREPNPIFRAAEGDLVRAMHTVRRVADVAALMANDLEPAVLALRPDVGRGARGAAPRGGARRRS